MLGGNKQRGKGWKPPLRTVSEFMTGSSHGWDSRRVAGEGSRGQRGRHGPQTSGLEWAGVAEADWMVINTAGAKADQKDRPGAWISHKCNTQVLIESLLKVQFTLVFSTGHFFFFFFFCLYLHPAISLTTHKWSVNGTWVSFKKCYMKASEDTPLTKPHSFCNLARSRRGIYKYHYFLNIVTPRNIIYW